MAAYDRSVPWRRYYAVDFAVLTVAVGVVLVIALVGATIGAAPAVAVALWSLRPPGSAEAELASTSVDGDVEGVGTEDAVRT